VSNVKDGEREGKRMRGKIERGSWQWERERERDEEEEEENVVIKWN
jgi:hypothetical protein